MDLQKLTIGQMAQLNHISEQTLRLYDRNGLLTPAMTDPATGYRYYHIGQSARLDMIQLLKTAGMTLRQIAALLDGENPEEIRALLITQQRAIEAEMLHLRHARAAVARNLENFQKYESLPKDGAPFFEFIGPRHIYSYACRENFFEQDGAGYEYMLRQLKGHLVANDIPLSYFSNIGTIVRAEYFERGELYSNEVFLFVDEPEMSAGVETLPSGMYLCICSDDFYAEAENAKRQLREAGRRGCRIAGDYVCEVVMNFPALEFHKRRMFYKIQVPVTGGEAQENSAKNRP